jgi:hypothetical protein
MTTSDFYGIIILRVPSVVYRYSSVSIWRGAVRGCNRKWRDRKWRQSRDRKSRQSGALSGSMFCACATGSCAISALVGPFDRKWRQSRDRKRPCPEVALTGSRFCARPTFSALFSLQYYHVYRISGFPWVCATGSCATPVVVVNNVGWRCSLWRPRPIFSYWN